MLCRGVPDLDFMQQEVPKGQVRLFAGLCFQGFSMSGVAGWISTREFDEEGTKCVHRDGAYNRKDGSEKPFTIGRDVSKFEELRDSKFFQ